MWKERDSLRDTWRDSKQLKIDVLMIGNVGNLECDAEGKAMVPEIPPTLKRVGLGMGQIGSAQAQISSFPTSAHPSYLGTARPFVVSGRGGPGRGARSGDVSGERGPTFSGNVFTQNSSFGHAAVQNARYRPPKGRVSPGRIPTHL